MRDSNNLPPNAMFNTPLRQTVEKKKKKTTTKNGNAPL